MEEQEVLLLGFKFAPIPWKVPDPLDYYEKYHRQCTAQYNALINKPSATPLPSLIEEHISAIAGRLGELAMIKTKTQRSQTREVEQPIPIPPAGSHQSPQK